MCEKEKTTVRVSPAVFLLLAVFILCSSPLLLAALLLAALAHELGHYFVLRRSNCGVSGVYVTALGAEAAERLQAEEQRQAEWAARLEAARAALDGIARAPELSATQRQAAAAQWLNQHFEGNERLRASVLLGL